MATVTRGYSFGSTEQVTNVKLHTLVDSATVTSIVNADVDAGAAISDTKLDLATIAQAIQFNGGLTIAALATMSANILKCAKGADVASVAGAITLGDDGNYFDITGTNAITSITAKTAGTFVILQFDSTASLVDGSNLKLAGNFQGAAESQIMLVSDGTNWFEVCRQPSTFTPTVSNALSGSVIQTVNTTSTSVTSGTTALPVDNTTPGIGEGHQILSRTITPNNASNGLKATVSAHIGAAGGGLVGMTIWQDSALVGAFSTELGGAGSTESVSFTVSASAGGTASQTWTVRMGHTSGTQTTMNGTNGSGLFNGSSVSTLVIQEIKA